jgi:hypothetical protein
MNEENNETVVEQPVEQPVEQAEPASNLDNLTSPEDNGEVVLGEDKDKLNNLLFNDEATEVKEDEAAASAEEPAEEHKEEAKEEPKEADKDFTAEQIETIKNLTRQPETKKVEQEQAKPTPRQYTKEELEQALGRVVITPEIASSLLGLEASPQQVAQLQTLLDGVAGYSMRAAAAYAKSREDQIRQDYDKRFSAHEQTLQPMENSMREQQAAVMVKTFYTKYPELDKYQSVVNNVVAGIKGTITDKDTFDTAAEKVASETKKLLSTLGIKLDAKVPTGANHSAPTKSSVPKMQPLSDGGRSQSKTDKSTKQSRIDSLLFN